MEITEPLLEKMRMTFRNMLEVAGILKTGHLTLKTRERDTEWVDLVIGIRPKTVNWFEAMKLVEGQITLSNLPSVEMTNTSRKLDYFCAVAKEIQELARADKFVGRTREDLTQVCEDTLEALSKAPKSQEKIDAALEVMGSIDDETAEHLEKTMEESRGLRHRVRTASGCISSDDWDDIIKSIEDLSRRSGARGKQLFELKRAIVQIKQKLKKEADRYQEDEERALDAEERDEHDQHGAFIRGIRAALVFLDGFENGRARFRICVICGKKLLITPPKGPEELPVPGRVVCESCTRKATDQTEQPELRPLLASMCNAILEIVEDFSDTDERSTSLVKHLTKLQERAERAGLVLATKL